jgi:GNAT superfamily N-acetyltransferase
MINADARLVRCLEGFICEEWRQLATLARSLWPDKGATYLDVGGGVALWLGEGGLVNVAAGLAMDGPIGEQELRLIEDFYTRRGAAPMLATCPFADPTLFALLGKCGWQLTEFENVLCLELDGEPGAAAQRPPGVESGARTAPAPPSPPGLELRVCTTPTDRGPWGALAARGFSDEVEPGPAHVEFGEIMAAHQGQILVLGTIDGHPAGTGSLEIFEDVAWLSADSTIPEFRGRGLQQAIQRYRIELAREAGCTLVVTEAMPGSGSQRNMERLGFRVIYTHLQFAKV